jgi:hypothetical protein
VDTNVLHVDTVNDNVGIGTTTPASALQVVGNRSQTPSTEGVHIGEDPAVTYHGYGIEIVNPTDKQYTNLDFLNTSASNFQGRIYYDLTGNNMGFHTNSSGVAGMVIDSSQRVGIGTATPASALQVVGSRSQAPTTEGVHIGEDPAVTYHGYGIEIVNPTDKQYTNLDFLNTSSSDFQGRIYYDLSNNNMGFHTNSSGSAAMVINSSGNVYAYNDLIVTGSISAGNFSTVGIDDNATSTAITIDSSQRVGIGTATPASALQVVGNRSQAPTTEGVHIGEDPAVTYHGYGIEIVNPTDKQYTNLDFLNTSSSDYKGRIYYDLSNNNMGFITNGSGSAGMVINSSNNVNVNNDLTVTGSALMQGNLYKKSTRDFSSTSTETQYLEAKQYPISNASSDEYVFSIDPTWSNAELEKFFGDTGTYAGTVAWDETEGASSPGGYAIKITGDHRTAETAGNGMPLIPVYNRNDGASYDDEFYMEIYLKNDGNAPTYLGSQEFDQNGKHTSTGAGNPGTYGYWCVSAANPGSTWTKYSGLITQFAGTTTGKFETDTKYWSPMALFNLWGASTDVCYISGWIVKRVKKQGPMIMTKINRYPDGTVNTSNTVSEPIGFENGGHDTLLPYKWNILMNHNNNVVFRYRNDSTRNDHNGLGLTKAYISYTGSSGVLLNFTGQHRSIISNEAIENNIENYIGLIVSSTGKIASRIYNENTDTYELKYDVDGITINESIPIVDISNTPNDKRCFGVISDREDENSDTTENTFGNLVSVSKKDQNDTRIHINSVGEGAIWVIKISNENIENGDYITTSAIEGYGMKQSDDLLHNYTVAKATMDCTFDTSQTDKYKTRVVTSSDGTEYTAAFISCTYHCG